MKERPKTAPTETSELDARTLLGLHEFDIGDELWVPISPIRGDKFRAMKISIEERVSINNYEEIHAIDKWPHTDRLPISHEVSEGMDYGCCSQTDSMEFEIEVDVTKSGSVQVEADDHREAIKKVHDMDLVELESRLTKVDVKHGGVYDVG